MASPSDRPQTDLDASRFLAEMKREALTTLVPEQRSILARIPLIGHLIGRHPDIHDLYLAAVEWEGWQALEDGRDIKWENLNPIDFLRVHASSIGAERAKQIVEIARSENHDINPSVFERMLGGKKK